MSDRGSRNSSLLALAFEYYQTGALSHHRLAADSDMPIVQPFLSSYLHLVGLSVRLVSLFVLHYSFFSLCVPCIGVVEGKRSCFITALSTWAPSLVMFRQKFAVPV